MTNDYPVSQPICYDIEKCIFYDHVNPDNSLCLSTEIDIAIKLKNSTSISDYINELLIPYFLSFEFWKKYNIDIFGDYSHGGKGIIESIKDYLNSTYITNEDCFYLLIWASKVKKFRKGIPREKQSYFIKYYIPLMKKLRLLSIPLLRRQYHLICPHFK